MARTRLASEESGDRLEAFRKITKIGMSAHALFREHLPFYHNHGELYAYALAMNHETVYILGWRAEFFSGRLPLPSR